MELRNTPKLTALPVEHLCDWFVRFSDVHLLQTPLGRRVIVTVAGGEVAGPRLRGRVLPGGMDWVLTGTDDVGRIAVRATLETHDGALVLMTNQGRTWLPPEAAERFSSGQNVTTDEMYARSTPLFETGDARYAWLNKTVCLAVNELSMQGVNYRVYQVL